MLSLAFPMRVNCVLPYNHTRNQHFHNMLIGTVHQRAIHLLKTWELDRFMMFWKAESQIQRPHWYPCQQLLAATPNIQLTSFGPPLL